jgi:hypothetical protein
LVFVFGQCHQVCLPGRDATGRQELATESKILESQLGTVEEGLAYDLRLEAKTAMTNIAFINNHALLAVDMHNERSVTIR